MLRPCFDFLRFYWSNKNLTFPVAAMHSGPKSEKIAKIKKIIRSAWNILQRNFSGSWFQISENKMVASIFRPITRKNDPIGMKVKKKKRGVCGQLISNSKSRFSKTKWRLQCGAQTLGKMIRSKWNFTVQGFFRQLSLNFKSEFLKTKWQLQCDVPELEKMIRIKKNYTLQGQALFFTNLIFTDTYIYNWHHL